VPFGDDGRVDLRIEADEPDAAEALRALTVWLKDEEGLRGQVRTVPRPAPPGTLSGSVLDAIVVTVGQGGAGALAVGAVVTWLRQRTTDVTIRITRANGESAVELSAKRVRSMDAAELRGVVAELSATLTDEVDDPGPDAAD
jgi:hypothetical protein